MESLLSPRFGEILNLHLAKVRVMSFRQAALLLKPEYELCARPDSSRQRSRRWNAACNAATAEHLRKLQIARVLGRLHAFHYQVPDVYDGAWYVAPPSGATDFLTTGRLAKALFLEHDNLKAASRPLFVRSDLATYSSLDLEHGVALTRQLMVTSAYLRLATSTRAEERALAQSWELSENRCGTAPSQNVFVDATAMGGKVSFWCPLLTKAECNMAWCRRYIECFDREPRSGTHLICVPWGFKAYKKLHGKYPWE
jgi:hypothetical protein